MAVSPITAAQQAPATTLTPEEDAQLATEFANMIVGTVGPSMAMAVMRQASFAKQTLQEALRDN